jgi:hypothetical protein
VQPRAPIRVRYMIVPVLSVFGSKKSDAVAIPIYTEAP